MKVLVIVTAFDEGELVGQALRSVLSQRPSDEFPCPEFEIIAVYDYGADRETRRGRADFAAQAPCIEVVPNRHRKGSAGARNTGIDQATGDWVAFMDGDDLWHPGCLAERWRAVCSCPEAGWLAADIMRGPSPPSGFEDGHSRPGTNEGMLMSNGVFRTLLATHGRSGADQTDLCILRRPVRAFGRWSVCHTSATMVRRDVLEARGGFSEWLTRAQDTNLWIRLAGAADLLFVRRPLTFYRIRPSTEARRGASRWGWDILGTLDLFRHRHLKPWFAFLYRERLIWCLNSHVTDMRQQGRLAVGAVSALLSTLAWPFQTQGWRGLVGSLLGRG